MCIASALEIHLQQKLHNRVWIEKCLEGDAESFPYAPVQDGKATLNTSYYTPEDDLTCFPSAYLGSKPLHLINMPMRHLPGDSSCERFIALFRLLKEEAFGRDAQQSKQIIRQRFAMVIGINQITSIDPSLHGQFIEYIGTLPRIQGIAYRVMGFFWNPQWKAKETKPHLLSKFKAFMLIKAFSSEMAERIRQTHEANHEALDARIASQVPFKAIRQTILDSQETHSFADYFAAHATRSPIYFGLMDDDCQKLRIKRGLFSRMDRLIQSNNCPSAVSLGYTMGEEGSLIRLGVKIDMKVRAAMMSVIPFSAYLPEPCLSVCIRRFNEIAHRLKDLSFAGKGRGLESRRLLQNGLKRGVLERTAVVCPDGGVMIGTPGRMNTRKTEKAQVLTPKMIKQRQYLQALRHISQTHATPKQWADNLYIALDFHCAQVTDVTTPMMHIFSVFDPISRMFNEPGTYSSQIFDRVIDEYARVLNTAETEILQEAGDKLKTLGMQEVLIARIREAARLSGQAIYEELSAYIPKTT